MSYGFGIGSIFIGMKRDSLISEALRLRSENKSLKEIAELLHISKSSASTWLQNTPKKIKFISEENKQRIEDALKRGRETSALNKQAIPLESLKSWTAVRKRVFKQRGRKCESCGWNEQNPFYRKIPVQVHHMDGDKSNNVDTNLKVLCPNCHSLTQFFGFFGRSRKTI